jgi:predicted transposase YbfD/YdcC
MNNGITEYFEDIELYEEYDGYFCSVPEVITIAILGSICGLRNVHQIHQWATNDRVSEFLKEKFGIDHVPCYYWILSLLKYVKPESLNRCFVDWVYSFMPEKSRDMTISLDGKTICSTLKMDKIESPLHIISAQVCELGLTLAQRCTDDKSNEIPAVQDLLKELKIKGNIVVADALNCQKETAEIIVKQKADYLLSVKDNHPNLKKDIEDFVQDIALQGTMQTAAKVEKSHGRIEARTAFVTADIGWLEQKKEWANLKCIGAIRTEFITKKGTSNEWHYYLSSRELTAEQLLHHARMEWSVESMHWLLDVHFEEDWCRVESKDVQQCLNMFRKAAINFIKGFKIRNNSKSAISNIMFECLMEPQMILRVVLEN